MRKNSQSSNLNRYSIKTDKNNSIIVEEINNSDLENVWNKLSEIQLLF